MKTKFLITAPPSERHAQAKDRRKTAALLQQSRYTTTAPKMTTHGEPPEGSFAFPHFSARFDTPHIITLRVEASNGKIYKRLTIRFIIGNKCVEIMKNIFVV